MGERPFFRFSAFDSEVIVRVCIQSAEVIFRLSQYRDGIVHLAFGSAVVDVVAISACFGLPGDKGIPAVFLVTFQVSPFYGLWDITVTVSEDAETGQGDISRRHVYILVFQITGMQRLVEFDVVMRTILVTVTLVYD
mgnify:CR=1 FL=1